MAVRMKIATSKSVILTFVAVLFFIPLTSTAQRPEFSVSDLKSKVVLKRLFNADSFDINGAAMWKPNFADSMEFESNVWSDGFCHSKLDTIMTYRENDSIQRAILVFSTTNEEGCMYCYPYIGVAEFMKFRKQPWTIEGFRKNLGMFGGENDDNGPLIALPKAGPQTWLLQLTTHVGTNPESIDNAHFFDDYGEVFAITIHHEDSYPKYSWDRKISFIIPKDQSELSSTDCYDIIAIQTGTLPPDEGDANSEEKKFSRKESYEYNFGLHRYERAK